MKAIIVDDEPHVLAVARLLVDWEKYHIHQLFECMDATEALEIIEREQPAILLSDIRMPQMDGLTLIEKAREKNPDLKSILISAYSDFAYAQKAVGLGCVDYLLKPLTEEGLNDAVEKAVTQYNYEKNLRSESQSDKSHILFSRYLQEGRSNEYWQNLLAAAPFLADTELFHLGILFSQKEDTALEPVAEFLHQYLYRENIGIAALRSKNIIVVLLPVYDYSPVERVQQLILRLEEKFSVSLPSAFSSICALPKDWDDAYISTKRMVLLSCGTDTLEQIHQYILEHYAEDLSLDYLAEHFGLSLSYLSRSFKKRYHNGLINFLTEIRINKAIVLMKDHSSSIAEIALQVGIPDPKYFSRVFRRVTGCSPAEYRKESGDSL